MKTQQLSITFPKPKKNLRVELIRLKKEENLNLSSFIISCIEKEIGIYT